MRSEIALFILLLPLLCLDCSRPSGGSIRDEHADLYADTGYSLFLALAGSFHHDAILSPLAAREDILPGKRITDPDNPKFYNLDYSVQLFRMSAWPDRSVAGI